MTTRRPVRRRAVEKDAAANIDITNFYAAATLAYGSSKTAAEMVERFCTDLERVALNPDGSRGARAMVMDVAELLWPYVEDRPDVDDLVRTMAKIGQRLKEKQGLIWCEAHGWLEPFLWGKCAGCPCQIPGYRAARARGIGRPRAYCSAACRQRAYRRRKGQDHRTAQG